MQGSMRNEAHQKKAADCAVTRARRRTEFVNHVHGGLRRAEAICASGVSRSTATGLVFSMKEDEVEFQKFLSPHDNRAER